MADRRAVVESRERGGERGSRVAVYQDDVGCVLGNDVGHSSQNPCRQPGQRLAGLHDVQILVGNDAEQFQNLVEHLPVLGGHHNESIDIRQRRQNGH